MLHFLLVTSDSKNYRCHTDDRCGTLACSYWARTLIDSNNMNDAKYSKLIFHSLALIEENQWNPVTTAGCLPTAALAPA